MLDALPPDQRRLAIRALADMAGNRERNALWSFDPLDPGGSGVPHMPQHEWMSAWKTPDGRLTKFRVFAGGNRAGKTTAGDLSLIIDACDPDAVPPHLQQYKRWQEPVQIYLVAVSGRAVERIHYPVFRKWTPKDQLVGGSFDKALNKEYQTLFFKNGSSISFLTQGMDTEVFQGTALHIVAFDEEPLFDAGREIFGECVQRLVDFNGDMRFTFTPLNGLTWVYDTLWLPWAQQQEDRETATSGFADIEFGGYKFPVYCHRVAQDDNPVIDDEGKAAAMAMAASDEERKARSEGLFVSMAGRVFDGFSRYKHVVQDDEVLERLKSKTLQMLIGGFDPGFRHMAAALWVGLDHDGIWVGPEVICQKTIVEHVAARISDTAQGLDLRLPLFVADPAIVKMDGQTGITDQVAYMNAGIQTRIGINSRRPGINAIRSLCDSNRIHIMASCDVLIDQLLRARWRTTGRSENDAPEDMVKRDDHAIDALRYAVMALPIPEALPPEDKRTKHQKMVADDIRRAVAAHEEGPQEFGPGFYE